MEETMSSKVAAFKSSAITVTIGSVVHVLKYDLNAFCELEKIYGSVDTVLSMILGKAADKVPAVTMTSADGADTVLDPDTVFLDGVALPVYLAAKNPQKEVRLADTRNLLWAGIIHETAQYTEEGDVVSYGVNRIELGKQLTPGSLKEVNVKIVSAIIRDILPPDAAPEPEKAEKN